jgi:hypothetical protein
MCRCRVNTRRPGQGACRAAPDSQDQRQRPRPAPEKSLSRLRSSVCALSGHRLTRLEEPVSQERPCTSNYQKQSIKEIYQRDKSALPLRPAPCAGRRPPVSQPAAGRPCSAARRRSSALRMRAATCSSDSATGAGPRRGPAVAAGPKCAASRSGSAGWKACARNARSAAAIDARRRAASGVSGGCERQAGAGCEPRQHTVRLWLRWAGLERSKGTHAVGVTAVVGCAGLLASLYAGAAHQQNHA